MNNNISTKNYDNSRNMNSYNITNTYSHVISAKNYAWKNMDFKALDKQKQEK